MAEQAIDDIKKSRGRPKADSTAIMVRIPPNIRAGIDTFTNEEMKRPEVIRFILTDWLSVRGLLGER